MPMPNKGIKNAIVTITVATCALIVFGIFAFQYFAPCYKCASPCSQVEADAKNIAASIADYFAVPARTRIIPADLDGPIAANPWTFVQCYGRFYIFVYDRSEDCSIDYQNSQTGWDSGVYTHVMNF